MRALFILLLAAIPLHASTVTGTFLDQTGAGLASVPVRFTPKSTPTTEGSNILFGATVSTTTDANGAFSVTLKQGDYDVSVNNKDAFDIAVPNDANSYNITALITTSLTYTYSTAGPALASLSDVTLGTLSNGEVLKYDSGTGKWVNGTTAGLGTVTSIAIASSGDYLVVSGSPITGAGTITLTADAEVEALADLAATGLIARTGAGALSARTITGDAEITVANGDGVSGNPTLAIAASIARDSELHSAVTIAVGRDYVTLSGQELTLGPVDLAADVTGELPGTAVGFADGNGDWTATTVGAALEEMVASLGGGPNAAAGKVHWTQLVGVPAGFADGTDDGAGGGSGDVVGPASATDNAVARFDTTTGKLIQNSVVTIDDSGNIATAGTVDGRDVSTDGTKLDGIEALADVTDTANVTAAGALMDSEVDADLKTLSLPASTTISAFGATLVDDADAAAARTTLGVDAAGTANVTLIESFTLESPTASDKVPWFRTDVAITITEVVVTLIGSSTPSVTVDLRHGTDLSAAGTALITSPGATTNTSTGNAISSFDDATLAANEILWFEADAVSGTVDWINITLKYTED